MSSSNSRRPFRTIEDSRQDPEIHLQKGGGGDLLPPQITYRKKMGFPTPLRQWLLDKTCRTAFLIFQRIQDKSGFLASLIDEVELAASTATRRVRHATDRIWTAEPATFGRSFIT